MRKFLRAMGVCILTVTMGVAMVACGKEEADGVVDIFDYVTVEYSGENGSGTANVTIDYDNLELEMVGGKNALKDLDDVEDLETLSNYINVVAGISFSIDKNTDLSNGDTVTVTATYDESVAESANVVFGETLSKTYEVKGLK
ncbi:MAG: hypothetical protein IKR14_02835 [Lachnospiraceae bacterium]|nr:hypothetical protein [Lachnospiraceae bacterium]